MTFIKYEVEVRLGIQKRNKINALVQIGTAVTLGAITGGVEASMFNKVGGLLKTALKKGYLSKKEITIANYVVWGKYALLKEIVSRLNTKPGNTS